MKRYSLLCLLALAACGGSEETDLAEDESAAIVAGPSTRVTIGILGVTFDSSTGLLSIVGSSAVDNITIEPNGSYVKLTKNGAVASYQASLVDKIHVETAGGADVIANYTTVPMEAWGGSSGDIILAGYGDDWVDGGSGADSIYGLDGNDQLFGSTGDDYIDGNGGDDLVMGQTGYDELLGSGGNDSIYGGPNDDQLNGGTGRDLMVTVGGGIDTLTGGSSLDNVWMDTADSLTDTSPTESSQHWIHRISVFESISYSGGNTWTAIGKEPDGADLPDPLPDFSQTGLSVDNFANNPLFAGVGPNKEDIEQGGVGDCYFLASLSALADAHPDHITKLVAPLGDGTFAVRFYEAGQPRYYRVDADLWVMANGAPQYADLGVDDAIWVPIVEKAYAFFRRDQGNYPSIAYGDSTHYAHLNVVNQSWIINDGITEAQIVAWHNAGEPNGAIKNAVTLGVTQLLAHVQAERAAGKALITGAVAGISNSTVVREDDLTTEAAESTYRRGQHIYMVDGVTVDANGNPNGMVLRDPYGSYRTITNFTRLYFHIGRSVTMVP